MKNVTDRSDLTGVLRDLDIRTARQERHSHHGVGTMDPNYGMAISGDFNNASLLGTDSACYTREIIVKATRPTAADFGGHLRAGCIWVAVEMGGPPVEPEPCGFTDDFERADGATLGSDWVAPASLPYGTANQMTKITTPVDFAIASGDAVGASFPFGSTSCSIRRWTGEIPGAQFLETTFTLPGTGTISNDEASINFYLLLDDTSFTCVAAQILQKSASDGFRLRWFHVDEGSSGDTSYDYFHDFAGSHTTTMRFEATPAGTVRALIGGTVIPDSEYDFGVPLTGTRVGMAARFKPNSTGGAGAAPPRIEIVDFGCLEA